jgi:hypothetical protein
MDMRWKAALAAAVLSTGVFAQSTPSPDAGATAAGTVPYASAFSDYRSYRDVDVTEWRQVNAAVGEVARTHASRPPATTPQAVTREGADPPASVDRKPAPGVHMHGGQGAVR